MITAGYLIDLMRIGLNIYPTYNVPLKIDGKEVDKVYMDITRDVPTMVITTKRKKMITIQELIDKLLKVEDKSKGIECEDPQTITYDIHIVEEDENTVKIYIA